MNITNPSKPPLKLLLGSSSPITKNSKKTASKRLQIGFKVFIPPVVLPQGHLKEVHIYFKTSRPPVEFSTDLKFRQTALSCYQNDITWNKFYKDGTGIFRTHWFLREIAYSEAVFLPVDSKNPFCFPSILQPRGTVSWWNPVRIKHKDPLQLLRYHLPGLAKRFWSYLVTTTKSHLIIIL